MDLETQELARALQERLEEHNEAAQRQQLQRAIQPYVALALVNFTMEAAADPASSIDHHDVADIAATACKSEAMSAPDPTRYDWLDAMIPIMDPDGENKSNRGILAHPR